jgi:hypothetical protein
MATDGCSLHIRVIHRIQSTQLNRLGLFQTFKAFQRRRKKLPDWYSNACQFRYIEREMTQLYLGTSDRYISGTAEFKVRVFAGITTEPSSYARSGEQTLLHLRHTVLKTKERGFSETSQSIFFPTTAARASYFVREIF